MSAELQQVVAAYAHALDESDVPALEAVLTEDTTWTFTMPGRGALGPVAGRAAVLDFVREHAARTGKVRHHLGNVLVTTADADADTGTGTADAAEVRAYLLQTENTGGNVRTLSTGVYTFGLRRSGGAWRIAELTLALDNPL
ncbi:nuclear transport factor 2 family protein [Streptomyces sp. B3I8]|uniref:nuclear transport factor 2 family protein n=1 Tax=Streptomyces sp. B3I8 TaxID=3042303 RepID=UPI0027842E7C|nr:nuclear transport factor 2 family protein [Streptomyces sp. B3I8]MDQ0790453.1 ketosteroid isomerase-like protein [Streptomyces sp. B3I8]